MPEYFDTSATTPVDPRVADVVIKYLRDEYGNAGSRTHSFGTRAAKAVELARDQVAGVADLRNGRVVFTSGATESNNLAIIGLEEFARATGRMHVVTSAMEHKAVLEPIERLERAGFTVTRVRANESGVVAADEVLSQVTDRTLLVSLMQVNNETGMKQPIGEIGNRLRETETIFHVDAAQGFGKDIETLRESNADLISISAHKIYGPKGVGALLLNAKNGKSLKLTPLMVGGGQEAGLRPGTLPVHLIAGLGFAAELARREQSKRLEKNLDHLRSIARAAASTGAVVNGDIKRCIGNVINLSFEGVDSESAMLILQDQVAISNGAACTSANYSHSHVLAAMGLPNERIESAIRISWYHDSPKVDWKSLFSTVSSLR
jgi:cysteine desulfurase